LLELFTGDVPFFATADTPVRSHHLNTRAPSARSMRPDVPTKLDTLVSSMLAKDPSTRPAAAAVYEVLLPLTTIGPGPDESGTAGEKAGPFGIEKSRDPTRPFRWPLLAPATSGRGQAEAGGTLTDAEAGLLCDNARALLDSDHPSEAIGLLESGIERAGHDPALRLRLRHLLGAALFYAGEYTRAASVLDAAGQDYRRYFPPDDPVVLDCAYYAGHAYAGP
jgi:serine/threonine protein kinase